MESLVGKVPILEDHSMVAVQTIAVVVGGADRLAQHFETDTSKSAVVVVETEATVLKPVVVVVLLP